MSQCGQRRRLHVTPRVDRRAPGRWPRTGHPRDPPDPRPRALVGGGGPGARRRLRPRGDRGALRPARVDRRRLVAGSRSRGVVPARDGTGCTGLALRRGRPRLQCGRQRLRRAPAPRGPVLRRGQCRRGGSRLRAADPRRAATLAGALVFGLFAGLTVSIGVGGPFLATASAVTASHAAAVLVFAPLGIAVGTRRTRRPGFEDLVQWVVVVGLTTWVFNPGQALPLAFLPIPVLVWGALRLGLRTVAIQLLVVGILAVTLTSVGGGPFAAAARVGGLRPETVGALTQAFLVTAAVTALSLAVASTQRRAALADLRSEVELSGVVLDTAASAIIVVDRAGAIARLNATAARLLGAAEAELVGRPAAEVFPVDDHERVSAQMAGIGEGAVPLHEEQDWRVTGLGVRHIVWTNAYLTDDTGHRTHLVKTGVDVTDERAARTFVEAVLEAATATAIIGTDLDGVITLFNRGAETVLGWRASEV